MSVKYFSTLILCLFNIVSFGQCPEYIKDFHNIKSENQESVYIERYKNQNKSEIKPYLIALNMKQSEHVSLPWKKIQIFNCQKKILDQFIKEHPYNIHARYMRYMIQRKAPSFLGYKNDYSKDKSIIIQQINKAPKCLRTYILNQISQL